MIVSREVQDRTEWDEYWAGKKGAGGFLYDIVAEFYRKFLIRPLLNYMLRRHFTQNSVILHAGCGSGQVDKYLHDYLKISALDLSANALEIYRRENPTVKETVQGSIFDIPMGPSTVDGIYNLGVMEHFTEEEIHLILLQYKKILKKDGKIVLFWPPEFGLSVLFFKALKIFYTVVLRKPDVKFHPDEVCRLKSKAHGQVLLQKAGFEMVDYYFGPRDVFTYSVVVGKLK